MIFGSNSFPLFLFPLLLAAGQRYESIVTKRHLKPVTICIGESSPILCDADHAVLETCGALTSFSGCNVLCDGYNNNLGNCISSNFQDGSVDCKDGACYNSTFVDMDIVTCRNVRVGVGSCRYGNFRRSRVNCTSIGDYNCRYSNFHSSAVRCGSLSYPRYSCRSTYFDPCSCCLSDQCPSGAHLCSADFCFSSYLGITCKDWGNPYCEDVTLPPEDRPTDIPTSSGTDTPTEPPTVSPLTDRPTGIPTGSPTDTPTEPPSTLSPTYRPTEIPTSPRTDTPTEPSTTLPPTDGPTDVPTGSPTDMPTAPPTTPPTDRPSDLPTDSPKDSPSDLPTASPADVLPVVTTTTETQVDESVNLSLTPFSDTEVDDESTEIIEEPVFGDVTIVETSDDSNELKFDYTPNPGFEGKDSFTVLACDVNGICTTLKMEIVVAAKESGGNEGLYALLSLLLAPCLWFFQEPLKRQYDKWIPHKETADGAGAGTTAAGTVGATSSIGLPTSVRVFVDQDNSTNDSCQDTSHAGSNCHDEEENSSTSSYSGSESSRLDSTRLTSVQ